MKTFIKRLKLPTPIYFKKMRAWIVWIGGSITMITSSLLAIHPDDRFLLVMSTVGVVFTSLGSVLSSLPVDWDQVKED